MRTDVDGWVALAAIAWDLSRRFTVIEQARKVNRTRGAWRRPQLTKLVSDLEGKLKFAYDDLEHRIVLLLVGEPTQAVTPERAALDDHGLPDADPDVTVNKDVLAAALLLVGAFRAQHLLLTTEAVTASFTLGRTQLLKRLGREDAAAQAATTVLLAQMVRRYEDDAQRFYGDLLDGSVRAAGIETILGTTGTVGRLVVALRALFDAESFRLSLLAEHAVWWSWIAGYRAAAVDGTFSFLSAGEEPPQFEWSGPNDARCCAPCRGQFGGPIVARSLSDLPAPSEICSYGVNCRHYWRVV